VTDEFTLGCALRLLDGNVEGPTVGFWLGFAEDVGSVVIFLIKRFGMFSTGLDVGLVLKGGSKGTRMVGATLGSFKALKFLT